MTIGTTPQASCPLLTHSIHMPRMQVHLLQLALVPCIPDVTRALFVPGVECLWTHCNSIPHFVLAVFLEEGLQNFCKILRCPWSRKPQSCLVCRPSLQGPLSSCAVSYSSAQAGECKQPKKLASPFISRVFFLNFCFHFWSWCTLFQTVKRGENLPTQKKMELVCKVSLVLNN